MAITYLQNEEIIRPGSIDEKAVTSDLLSVQSVGKGLYSQIWKLTIKPESGSPITVITKNTFSLKECSESGVDVWIVSQHLGGPND